MWSHPNPGVAVPRPSPESPRAAARGQLCLPPPLPAPRSAGTARARRCRLLVMSLPVSPALALSRGCGDGAPALTPRERAAGGGRGHRGTPARSLPSPRSGHPPITLHLFLVSLPPPGPSLCSGQAVGRGGVLAAPEDPEERRGAQGEGAQPCPPECQELAAVPTPQVIKRFLKEDSDEAELTQFLRDCPAADSSRKVEAPESRREPGHPLGSGARVPPDEGSDERDARIFSRSRPADFQQHIAAPPPPSPNRPRSPWGQLDPYDSSEDDKEYVGFATLPNQVHRKSVKKGFDFTLMVAGESGLGKSTLVNSLFLTDMYRDRKLLNAEERITQTVEITKHVVDIEEKGVKLRLTIVDTPGFGDAVNNTECWKPVADYIDQQFEQYFRDESGLNRKNIQDNRVHCCIYFISPFGHGLRPLDVEFMRALHQRVNIVPVLAKADTLTPAEVERMKNKIREEIDHYGIRIYQFPECDSDEDEEFKLQDQALKESIPFAVIGSNTVVEAKGRRVRGRLYPWGIVEVENPSHCDFVKLRTMLVRTHMQDLKDVTRETHYENYRTQCIQSMTRMVVKERNRNKLTRESGTDFPIPVIPPVPDVETEKLIREKDEELRRMQEMLQKIQKQMKDSH
ncbi:septin-4 isoform X3 [Melospiza melodia melodia]|uniref:septin-4 isoform X3 n=1 Tax=Melospiza melodia melodia TaxID=1914991 RepID=UPI002FD73DCD